MTFPVHLYLHAKRIGCVVFGICLFFANAYAMTFEVVMLRAEPAIKATGEILQGDAERLKAVLVPMAKHSYGYYAMVLDSPGGDVAAAFEISRLMDKYPIHTYIAPNAKCISACAAIVFIAGKEHVAVPGSYLGFHGCYSGDTKAIIQLCNARIAEHAFQHGTAYGSVMAFIQEIPYDEIVWITGDQADCWGINKYAISSKPNGYEKCVRDAMNAALMSFQKKAK